MPLRAMNTSNDSKQTWTYIWKTMFAGGLAGCAAKTLVAPLDRVKILYQTNNPEFHKYTQRRSVAGVAHSIVHIRSKYGLLSLFQGHSLTLMRIFPYAAIKFMAFEQYKVLIFPEDRPPSPLERLLSGSLAGITSVLFTYPLEVVRVRLAFSLHPHSVRSLLATIHQEKGRKHPIFNFYRGLMPTLYGMIPYAGISFTTYDLTSQYLHTLHWSPHTTNLVSGGIAGAISQTIAYPFEVIRRRMQIGGHFHVGSIEHETYKSSIQTGKYILHHHGVRGMFVGLSIGYMKVVPMSMVSYWTYAMVKKKVLYID